VDIFNSTVKGDYDVYRRNYERMSFRERQEIPDKWFEMKGTFGAAFRFDRVAPLITYIHHPIGKKRFHIFEFGCGEGKLAMKMFGSFDKCILSYEACDFCSIALSACAPSLVERKKFRRRYLDKQLWELSEEEFNIEDYTIFLSSHTLEHITEEELRKLFKRIEGIRFLVLELPFDPWLKWMGTQNTHVLGISAPDFVKMLYQFGYDLLRMLPNTFAKSRKTSEARTFLFEYRRG